jgi:ribosomal 50S subunit-recycling heat shock protein
MVEAEDSVRQTIAVPPEAAGQRLDLFLAAHLDGVSRSRVQMLMDQGDVLVDGEREKASLKLRGGEQIVISGEPRPEPLKATAEDIPLDVVYEDADLAVVNKPAGMMVHAGSGQNEDARSSPPPAAISARASCTGLTKTPAASSSSPKTTAPTPPWAKCFLAARCAKLTLPWCRAPSSAPRAPSMPA